MNNTKGSMLIEELRKLAGLVFGRELDEVPSDAAVGAFEPWDSLGHVEFMMAVESQFGVGIPSERLGDLISLELISEYLIEQGLGGE